MVVEVGDISQVGYTAGMIGGPIKDKEVDSVDDSGDSEVGVDDSGTVDDSEEDSVDVANVVEGSVVDDDSPESVRSPKKILHRTKSSVVWRGARLVLAGQQAFSTPSARFVHETDPASSQAEGWST